MKNNLADLKTAAIIGLFLALPGAIMLALLILHIEPPLGTLNQVKAWKRLLC